MRVKRKRSPKHRRRTVQLPLSTTDSPAVVHLPVPLNLPLGVAPHLLLKFGRLSHIASSLWRFRCVCVVLMLGLNLSARRCAPRPSCVASLSRSFFFFGGGFHLGGQGLRFSPISVHSSKSQLPNQKISPPVHGRARVQVYSRSATAPGARGEDEHGPAARSPGSAQPQEYRRGCARGLLAFRTGLPSVPNVQGPGEEADDGG